MTDSTFFLWGSKITADGDCSHEIERHLLLGRKAMTNLHSVLKSRDITLPTKVCLVKAMVFPVVMYGGESWTIKKAECRRIDAFELWCWRRLLRVPWTARRSNQSILKEISPEYPLEGLMLKLKLQSFGHLMRRAHLNPHLKSPWCWEWLKAGRERDDRGWDSWIASPTQWTWVWVNSASWWWSQRVRCDWGLNWTELTEPSFCWCPRWAWSLPTYRVKTTEWYSLLEDFFKLLTVFEKAQSKGNQAQEIKRFLYSLIQLMMNCIVKHMPCDKCCGSWWGMRGRYREQVSTTTEKTTRRNIDW